MAVDVSAILHAFADLAPEGAAASITFDVTTTNGLVWLGNQHSTYLGATQTLDDAPSALLADLATMSAHDQLHKHEQRLREGWVFLAGRTTIDDQQRTVCLPLLTAPVILRRPNAMVRVAGELGVGGPNVEWIRRLGDHEVTSLIADRDQRGDLETNAEFGGGGLRGMTFGPSSTLNQFPQLQAWIRDTARAAGLEITEILPPTANPRELRRIDGLVAVVGSGIYAVESVDEPEQRRTLREWAAHVDSTTGRTADSAFAKLYSDIAPLEPPDEPVRSPLPLTAAQRSLVVRSRHDDITVASGAPGTGKSHAVVAIAIDAVLRGDSVLVATQSSYAADVLADLLDRHPGPTPLLFGNGERRTELLDELDERLRRPIRNSEIADLDAGVTRAADEVTAARRVLTRSLELEAEAISFGRWEASIPALTSDVPGIFAPDVDLDAAERLAAVAGSDEPEWFAYWSRRRHRKAQRQLRRVIGAAQPPDPLLRDAIAAARARRAAAQLSIHGGTRLDGMWERLIAAESQLCAAIGARAAARDQLPESWTNTHRRSVSALLTALRAGRGRRRQLLAELDVRALAHAVPLWIGNLHDIEDLLPASPGLFDLVILDEASQIDQPYGARALLRAERAVVVGDPRQLRHVSFVADANVQTALEMRDLGHLADRLDLRRVSTFDAAAAAAPVTWLDEHHRSVPHLIEFSTQRFYRNRVKLLTRHPTTHAQQAIEVVHVDGTRDGRGVNRGEIDRAIDLLGVLGDEGCASVGIVTPFRAQADAIEAAVIARLDLDQIMALGLRVGTVHAFQGGEREVVIVSLALDDDSPAGSQRFVEDPSLFNVMVTRARQRLIVLTSQTEPGGLVGEYLAWSESPPVGPTSGEPTSPWSAALGRELQRAGFAVSHRYPVGTWEIDLVVGNGASAIGIECGPHPDGPSAHIERHLALTAAGWRLIDAFPSRWDHQAATAAVDLAPALP